MAVKCLYICKPQFLVAQGVELNGIVGWAESEDMSYTMTSSLIYPIKGGRRDTRRRSVSTTCFSQKAGVDSKYIYIDGPVSWQVRTSTLRTSDVSLKEEELKSERSQKAKSNRYVLRFKITIACFIYGTLKWAGLLR